MELLTSTVDQTADVAIKTDVVQIGLGGDNFALVFLGPVAQLENVLLSVLGVRVKVDLGIHGQNFTSGVFGKGVDFEEGAILNLQHELSVGTRLYQKVTFSMKRLYILIK